MNDTPANLPATRPARQVVADVIPVFDSSRFEHYGRIATVLADAPLVPDTLKVAGDRQASIANCFQVVELADRLGFSPFAVAQCASVVHGKLMLEGKLVSAALDAKLKLKLHHYYIGEWGHEDYRIFVTDRELTETEIEELRPHVKIPGVRMVDGSVKEWRTKEKGGGVKGNWLNQPDVQLQYRGDRTWARLFESAIMLGVYTEEEFDELQDRRLPVEQAQPSLTAGMSPPKPRQEAEKPAPATEAAGKSAEAAPGAAAATGESEAHEEVHDAEFIDGGQGGEGEQSGAETSTQSATSGQSPTSDHEQTSSGSSPSSVQKPSPETTQTDTEDSSTATSPEDGKPASASTSAEPQKTRAPMGELYCLAGDEVGADGKVPTYKDGVPFSRVKADSKSKPAVYDLHPIVDDDDVDAEGLQGVSEAQDKLDAENAAGGPFTMAIEQIGVAKGYLQGKQVVKTLSGGAEWQTASAEQKASVRKALWDRYVDLRDNGEESIGPHEDLQLMQCFLEFGAISKEAVDQLWRPFWKGSAYKQATEASQRAITDLMLKRKEQLP